MCSSWVNLTPYSGVIFFRSYFNSKKDFKELFFRSKNHPRFGVNTEELKNPPPPQKGVFLYLKFLLHFWSYNNSLVNINVHENKMAAYENELDRKECGFINSLRVKRVNNNDKRILNCLGFTYNM